MPIRAALSSLLLAAFWAAIDVPPVAAQLYQVRPMRKPVRYAPASPRTAPRTDEPAARSAPATDTVVNVEVFTGNEGVGLPAQQWRESFDRAGIAFRVRPGAASDKIDIQERRTGKLREVFVTGKLERNGTLVFPSRSFARSESAALEEWLREVKTYGAQGNPFDQPQWGLSQQQFDGLFQALSAPVDRDATELAFDEAVRSLDLPPRCPLRMTVSAEKVLQSPGLRRLPSRVDPRGFSQGTALAMVLSQYGLAFRPTRTPAGSIELSCVAAADGQPVWPTGWDRSEGTLPAAFAPRLYEQTVVELKDQKLVEVLDAIAAKTQTPIRIDRAQVDARGLDLDSVLVSVARRHATWSLLLAQVTAPSFLSAKIRCDERKRPFVWITPLPKKSSASRP